MLWTSICSNIQLLHSGSGWTTQSPVSVDKKHESTKLGGSHLLSQHFSGWGNTACCEFEACLDYIEHSRYKGLCKKTLYEKQTKSWMLELIPGYLRLEDCCELKVTHSSTVNSRTTWAIMWDPVASERMNDWVNW